MEEQQQQDDDTYAEDFDDDEYGSVDFDEAEAEGGGQHEEEDEQPAAGRRSGGGSTMGSTPPRRRSDEPPRFTPIPPSPNTVLANLPPLPIAAAPVSHPIHFCIFDDRRSDDSTLPSSRTPHTAHTAAISFALDGSFCAYSAVFR